MIFAFYAQTEYQLLNIVKFVLNDCEESKGKSDLFLSDRIEDSGKKREIFLEQKIFEHIYIVKSIKYNHNKVSRKAKMLWYILNKSYLNKLILGEVILNRRYDVIVVGSASIECEIFWNYFEFNDLYFVEDGLGSMMGSVKKDTYGKIRKVVSEILYKQLVIKKMYISNMDFCIKMPEVEYYRIPNDLDNEFSILIDLLYMPLNYCNTFEAADIIYLQQPMSLFGRDFVNFEKLLIRDLKSLCGNQLILRDHPKNAEKNFPDIRSDGNNYMWEFVSKKNISNSNILIGLFSTAQFTPKMLFDCEPFVIFLFNLFPVTDERKKLESIIAGQLKKAYRDPFKVVAPESFEDLRFFLEKYAVNTSLI